MNHSTSNIHGKKTLCPSSRDGTLFGRHMETKTLLEVRSRLFRDNDDKGGCEALWIHGVSGSGKTVLARQLQRGTVVSDAGTPLIYGERKFYFIEGKFDQYQDYSTPYSALVHAFNSLGEQIRLDSNRYHDQLGNSPISSLSTSQTTEPKQENADANGEAVQDGDPVTALNAALEHEGGVLRQIIPSFALDEKPDDNDQQQQAQEEQPKSGEHHDIATTAAVIAGGDDDDDDDSIVDVDRGAAERGSSSSLRIAQGLDMATQRLAFAFACFLKRFCSPTRPVILFCDDLQWSDRNALDVLITILNDEKMHNFLLVGGYRDELKADLDTFFGEIDNENVSAADILVQNLSATAIHELLTSVLSLEPENTKELANTVFHKTDGNPFFVFQYLETLKRWKLLRFDLMRVRWTWDIRSIQSNTNVADNVAELVTQRLNSVSPDVRRLLQLAACLGFQIDRSLLEQIYCHTVILGLSDEKDADSKPPEQNPVASLEEEEKANSEGQFDLVTSLAEEDALLESAGTAVKFSHDRIRQLSYELVPEGEKRCQVHYALGTYLKESFGDSAASPYLLLATDQLNRGTKCAQFSESDNNRLVLMRLNLEASKVAKQRSAEMLVYDFLSKALTLAVDERDWEESYDMVLEIHIRLYDVEAYRNNVDRAHSLFDAIMKHARQPSDKASALAIKARSLSYKMQQESSIKYARKALTMLGVTLKRPKRFNEIMEYTRIKRMLDGMSDEELLGLPPMKDKKMKKAMRILLMISIFGFAIEDRRTISLSFFKMIQLSLQAGFSVATASGFAGYAQVLSHCGKHEEAFRFASLALKAEKNKENTAATASLIQAFCLHIRKPLASSLEPTLAGYRAGLKSGDLFFGSVSISKYLQVYVLCGLPLSPFVSDCKNFMTQIIMLKQGSVAGFILPNIILALNLTGQMTDPGRLSWEQGVELGIFEPSELDVAAFERSPARLLVRYYRMLIACVLNDTALMEEVLKSIWVLKRHQRRFLGSHCMNYLYSLLDGLCGYALFQKYKRRRFLRLARQGLQELKAIQNLNSFPMIQFLEAEHASVDRSASNKEQAKSLYEKAITSLARSGFTHFAAMAYERAGRFMLLHHDHYWAKEYLKESVRHFDEWGCTIKTARLREEFPKFLATGDRSISQTTSVGILGRKRFASVASAEHRHTETSLAVKGVVDSKKTNSGRF